MSKSLRVLIILAFALLAIPLLWMWSHRARRNSALAIYKAQLRAQGEKLSWAELGYPRAPEVNDSLQKLLAAVDKIGPGITDPGQFNLMSYVGPGRAQPCWASPQPLLGNRVKGANGLTWEEFQNDNELAQVALEEIRASLRNPPRYFLLNPSNFLNWPKYPLVQQRKAAQWLVGDAILALHANQLKRTQADLHALTQLMQLHREDPMLVSQMIRVAIVNWGLAATWEALQAEAWHDEALVRLQKDWENVELLEGLNRGLLGERIFGETFLEQLRQAGGLQSARMLGGTTSPTGQATLNSLEDYFSAYVVKPLWRVNSEDDELFLLQHYQSCFEFLHELDGAKPWPETAAKLTAQVGKLNRITSGYLGRVRYQVSFCVIPNISKAALTTVRGETWRRLTVTAIALERHRMRHGRPPTDLAALVPEFLRAVPLDPMNGKPLGYRLTTSETFTLYSVGEDGHDDGGDPTASGATNGFDLWSGKDIVWPRPIPTP